jgi:hypothetical protein
VAGDVALEVPRLSAVSVRSSADADLADRVAGRRSWPVRKAVDGGPASQQWRRRRRSGDVEKRGRRGRP